MCNVNVRERLVGFEGARERFTFERREISAVPGSGIGSYQKC